MDNGGYLAAAYLVALVVIGTYTWRLARRVGRARRAAGSKRGEA